MQAREHTTPHASPTSPEKVMAWTAPAAHQPARALAVLAVVIFTWWVALLTFHSWLIALVGSMAIMGSVAESLFPIHHRITSQGVSTRCAWQWRTMAWNDVRSARRGADGIHLSPIAGSGRLARLRGVTLRFAGADNSAVLAAVRRYYKGGDTAR